MLIAWVISLIAVFFLGYYFRSLRDQIEALREITKAKVDKKKLQEEPKSELIDMNDPVKEALYQQKIIMDKLNEK